MDISALLKKFGLELPEDKAGEFDKEFRQSWKHHTELDSKLKELDAARAELKTRDTQLTELKKVDASELQKRISELEDTNKTAQKQHESDMAALRKSTALKLALADKVYDPDDIIGRLDLEKIEMDGDKLKGTADDLLAPFKESKPYLFKPEAAAPVVKGAKPMEGLDPGTVDTGYQTRLSEARQSGNNTEAVRIISEAAQNGINLR